MYYDNDDMKIRDVTWETCTLRKQLNSVFYDEAFNESEKSAVKQVTVKTDDNPEYGTDGGNDTLDKVFVLSIEEARKTEYGFDSSYDSFVMNGMGSITRYCNSTEYAQMNSTSLMHNNNATWVLRSPGVSNKGVTYIVSGSFFANEMNACSGYDIRPAIWIDLSSPVWETSGTVSTGAGSIDISQTTPEPDSTPEPTKMPDLNPAPMIQPSSTPNATQVTTTSGTNTQTADAIPRLKSIKLTSVKCKKGAKQIRGKVSVSGAAVKIKVGSKEYKKATVKELRFHGCCFFTYN